LTFFTFSFFVSIYFAFTLLNVILLVLVPSIFAFFHTV
jgi:hypothetical protein